jgi:hypothetical protein
VDHDWTKKLTVQFFIFAGFASFSSVRFIPAPLGLRYTFLRNVVNSIAPGCRWTIPALFTWDAKSLPNSRSAILRPTAVAEQRIPNQLFDQNVRGILQITQQNRQSGSSALNKEG